MATDRPPPRPDRWRKTRRATARGTDPSPESLRNGLLLAAAAAVDLLSRTAPGTPTLTVLLAVVAYVTLRDERRAGPIGAAVVSGYGVYCFSVGRSRRQCDDGVRPVHHGPPTNDPFLADGDGRFVLPVVVWLARDALALRLSSLGGVRPPEPSSAERTYAPGMNGAVSKGEQLGERR